MLSAEYFVLDGAKAIALPTPRGQSLSVFPTENSQLTWSSFDHNRKKWFEISLELPTLTILQQTDPNIGHRLQSIFQYLQEQKPTLFSAKQGYHFETYLEFPRAWGLGTSSTLISCLAQWVAINPYAILEHTFGGSGYDIACATANTPIFYQRTDDKLHPVIQEAVFTPPFAKDLYFVYLEKKQNSREGIQHYRKRGTPSSAKLQEISTLSEALVAATDRKNFEDLLLAHEHLVAEITALPRAQDLYFKSYPGIIKSLGAWGGDFVLATSLMSGDETKAYFNQKGFTTVLRYEEMVGLKTEN